MRDEYSKVVEKARMDMESTDAGPSQIQQAVAAADPAANIGYSSIKLNRKSDFNEIEKLDTEKVSMIKEASLFPLDSFALTKKEIASIARIFPQLKKLQIQSNFIDVDLYESILKWCSNLKYLHINIPEFDDELAESIKFFNGLLHHYPTIEHFKFDSDSYPDYQLTTLTTFLQLNPNIKTFSINADFLQERSNYFLGSNIQIDQFNVYIDECTCVKDDAYDKLCRIFNHLYEQGFYKRLHLFISYVIDQSEIDQIELICGMEKLYINEVLTDQQFTWQSMPNLREICIGDFSELWNTDSMAQNFINLERVYFRRCRTVDILPFIRYARNLKKIKIDNWEESSRFKNGIIDLPSLNEERKRFAGACKVTIYVKEDIFLSTKFAMTNTELSLVNLERAEAVEWAIDPDGFLG